MRFIVHVFAYLMFLPSYIVLTLVNSLASDLLEHMEEFDRHVLSKYKSK
jgi:hypothetical protein